MMTRLFGDTGTPIGMLCDGFLLYTHFAGDSMKPRLVVNLMATPLTYNTRGGRVVEIPGVNIRDATALGTWLAHPPEEPLFVDGGQVFHVADYLQNPFGVCMVIKLPTNSVAGLRQDVLVAADMDVRDELLQVFRARAGNFTNVCCARQ